MTQKKTRPRPTQRLERITPAKAKTWLEHHNGNNRDVNRKAVDRFMDVIEGHGGIPLTHQGIAFDWDGNLIDGQHRLTAIVETGITCMLFVCRNLDPAVAKYIDGGDGAGQRSMGDQLKIEGRVGHVNKNMLAVLERLRKLYPVSEEAFPLPEEAGQ